MLYLIIITSLFCNGLHIITRQGQILFPLRTFIEDLLFIQLANALSPNPPYKNIPTLIYKPILGCIKCMASVWGITLSLTLLPINTSLLYQIPIICICSSTLNAILYQLYE